VLKKQPQAGPSHGKGEPKPFGYTFEGRAALADLSGVIVAIRMYETHPSGQTASATKPNAEVTP
jgi:hypothetical protein